ncbi:ABC transporter permease [Flavobacterium sp.]|uniref:MlaE family ABC transporter permease n=1 Tax=Flavobacterium sp. TaxID=239 RepID=UPI002489E845|nr:ABC transporter permease [Flavobacterium sp.]MDI1317868.1 ABC transporter permease [Flavobacterium sp.]
MMKTVPISNIKKYAHKKTISLTDETLFRKSKLSEIVRNTADVGLFLINVVKNTFSCGFEFNEFIKQCFQVGNKSLGLISITGIVIGLVLTIQSRPVLVDFGAVNMLPGMVAISIIREMGPVITALICAGKVGSGIGAELGSMRVTEQIDAMEVSSTNPVRFLIVPRVLATTLMLPLLALYADILGILGSWIASNIKGDVSFVLFISQAFGDVDFMDFLPAVIKSFFFGAVIGLVGCYKGFNAGRGTESVGKAANSAVVMGSLLVIIVDLIAVQITDLL